ncbi:hypothetical protein [Bacillus marinisedimentorum]|uniref:hypothetical protein n=1 Tax=Bacillus marinisedimentorum TaxID=1821260 RepID=UPI0007DF74B0|nr:hypothetical protein [Bacillus marinisedimentorum]
MKSETMRKSINWSLGIAVTTLVLAAIFSVVSTFLLSGVAWGAGMLIVLAIVLTGVFFDMLGIAATAADEVPFNAMASERVYGARESLRIVRNADRFASFCNDVIGDISGIISGTATAIVIMQITVRFGYDTSFLQNVINVMFTSVVAALTVGGKALGKTFAIQFSTDIILYVGRFFRFVEERLHITIFSPGKKDKNHQKKRKTKRK